MRALLDTHVFLWAAGPSELLSSAARLFLEAEENELMLSAASLWEIQLKAEKGMLLTGFSSARKRLQFLRGQIEKLGIDMLAVQPSHIFALAEVPKLHNDPFDRLLIAQARVEGVPLLTGDRAIRRYQVQTIW